MTITERDVERRFACASGEAAPDNAQPFWQFARFDQPLTVRRVDRAGTPAPLTQPLRVQFHVEIAVTNPHPARREHLHRRSSGRNPNRWR